MTFPPSGTYYRPGGGIEIPGLDPDWETVPKREHRIFSGGGSGETVADKELYLPLAQGETVPFDAMLFFHGDSSKSVLIIVNAPTGSLGGFIVQGIGSGGEYQTKSYGADDFNSPVDAVKAGVDGDLESWHAVHIEGMVVAGAAGRLRISAQTASSSSTTLKAGSYLKGFRQHDARLV